MAHEYPNSDLRELNYSKQRRITNEQLFYDLNQRIRQSTELLLQQASVNEDEYILRFACECGDASCLTKLSLDIATFNKIHAADDHYMVLPGHEQLDIEEVVERHDKYLVVKKFITSGVK